MNAKRVNIKFIPELFVGNSCGLIEWSRGWRLIVIFLGTGKLWKGEWTWRFSDEITAILCDVVIWAAIDVVLFRDGVGYWVELKPWKLKNKNKRKPRDKKNSVDSKRTHKQTVLAPTIYNVFLFLLPFFRRKWSWLNVGSSRK